VAQTHLPEVIVGLPNICGREAASARFAEPVLAGEAAPPRRRAAGILLHITSLPGRFGIGDLGPAASAWLDVLVRARQTYWQMLPLGPTIYGDSPYACSSAFAGNPNLISPELLVRDGLLHAADLPDTTLPAQAVDYGRVIDLKLRLTAWAWERFNAGAAPQLAAAFDEFCVRHAAWLDDFADFQTFKELHGGRSWLQWPKAAAQRRPDALRHLRRTAAERVKLQKFRQFLFFRQWADLRDRAAALGIRLIGDVPFFVSADSADVWVHAELFALDRHRRPLAVGGVPPDSFSPEGQRWGNPVYRWAAHRDSVFAWWIARLRAALELVDYVRFDHFRGIESCWEIPARSPTAARGRWVKGPGAEMLQALEQALGGLPLLPEDLGVITPEVDGLRQRFGLPSTRILQFAFGPHADRRFVPHRYDRNMVVYTGTHDNDTTRGWFAAMPRRDRRRLRRYLPATESNMAWDLIRAAWASVADLAIVPLQDVLNLGSEARMNVPGTTGGCWRWRFTEHMLRPEALDRLAEWTELYERVGGR
jgi:4-alpha-glucanotransferase